MSKFVIVTLTTLSIAFLSCRNASSLEYVVTDDAGTILGGSSILNLGDQPIPKNVLVYLKYTTAEANIINGVGTIGSSPAGFYSGSYQFAILNTARATVAATGDMTTAYSWQQTSKTVPTSLPTSSNAIVSFVQNANTARLDVTPVVSPASTGMLLLGQVLISPGSAVNPIGTTFTLSQSSGGDWISTDKTGAFDNPTFWNAPTLISFTVVPEPSTIAMGLISGISLVATGFYRRRQVKMSKSIV